LKRDSAIIVWLRHDLRLSDNCALHVAAAQGRPVIPVFVWAPEEEGKWPPGPASKWWLHHSLEALDRELRRCGSRLIIRKGPTIATLRKLAVETGANAVYWNRRYEVWAGFRDAELLEALYGDGLIAETFRGNLLFEPGEIQNSSGGPFQVFTPFWKACLRAPEPRAPLPSPRRLRSPARWPKSLRLGELELLPRIDWATGIRAAWQPGESGAQKQLKRFLHRGLAQYGVGRDRPDHVGTSRLSPHLHFGEIGPRQVWNAIRARMKASRASDVAGGVGVYLRQLVWREFAHHLLYHFPQTADQPLREEFRRFPWRKNKSGLAAWQRGLTGYPLVDAGMRELWTTGWMHNRVRMIVGSFLVKDLLLPWQDGARWFWDTLVDADLANNTLGWQWVAGCGADAALYFRIFNPMSQGAKFAPQGDYVRRWVPELGKLPARWIHHPWDAPPDVLAAAAVHLGKSYPRPIVNHAVARKLALAAYAEMKRWKRDAQ
jgi:deoxyribodipyrimidine photo-lyase